MMATNSSVAQPRPTFPFRSGPPPSPLPASLPLSLVQHGLESQDLILVLSQKSVLWVLVDTRLVLDILGTICIPVYTCTLLFNYECMHIHVHEG